MNQLLSGRVSEVSVKRWLSELINAERSARTPDDVDAADTEQDHTPETTPPERQAHQG